MRRSLERSRRAKARAHRPGSRRNGQRDNETLTSIVATPLASRIGVSGRRRFSPGSAAGRVGDLGPSTLASCEAKLGRYVAAVEFRRAAARRHLHEACRWVGPGQVVRR